MSPKVILCPRGAIGLFLGFAVLLAGQLSAATPPLWGDLDPGPYAVGFRTIEKYDFSRTFRTPTDYFGDPVDGEIARPIQACIWYPAKADPDAMTMVYSEYSIPFPQDNSFANFVAALQNVDLTRLFGYFNGQQPLVLATMDIEMAGIRDAEPAEGSFPLIIYHGSQQMAYNDNLVLCEYLASHGYVVATTHSFGVRTVRIEGGPDDFETLVRDKEVVEAIAIELPYVDRDRQGLLGFGSGGSTALVHLMRHPELGALATIHAGFLTTQGLAGVVANPFYATTNELVPWLCLYSAEGMTNDLSMIDSLQYCPRYEVAVSGYSPQQLNSYWLVAGHLAPDSTNPPEVARRGHDLTCRATLEFFDHYLMHYDSDQLSFSGLDSTVRTAFFNANPVPPTSTQFAGLLQTHGSERVETLIDQYDLLNPEHPILPDGTFVGLGYGFLTAGRVDDALAVFKWNVTAYPTSANAWDSYGEACSANDDVEQALACYRKAVELAPSDTTLPVAFRGNFVERIGPIIEGLEQRLAERNAGGR